MKKMGFINEGECRSTLEELQALIVNKDHENYPSSPDSPNYPRGEGRPSYLQNPILGDPGRGEIGRWSKVKTDAVANLIDQLIAHFMEDRKWLKGVRCKEALWNMYRRLEWWVEQNVGLEDYEYKLALEFVRDCIESIIDSGEDPTIIEQYKFAGIQHGAFNYNGNWYINGYGYLEGVTPLDENEVPTTDPADISIQVNYPTDGIVNFRYAPEESFNRIDLYINGESVWGADWQSLKDQLLTFQDITVKVPKGMNTFKWEIRGGSIRFDEIVFTEFKPVRESNEELPQCPPSYIRKFRADYGNNFDGRPYERPIFTTKDSEGISDPFDIIRFNSSKENIEWERIKFVDGEEEVIEENILKLPLERLPETLSSKLTFNMRVKKKGYISFKYWMESGRGSDISLYINNRKSTYNLGDTEGWREVKVNLSQAQTYKFDIMVHKAFSSDIGRNAVYVKDIEVVESTGNTENGMPGDYSYEGQKLTDKWLIYSHNEALASYYRGFPDGADDMVREFSFELFSECDGVFGFEHILGTEDPDRYYIDGTVFLEGFKFNETPVVWEGKPNGLGVPSITTKPTYGEWYNTAEGEPEGVNDLVYWTKDSTELNYNVTLDDVWDRGEKRLSGFIDVAVLCPPKYLIAEGFADNSGSGSWNLGSKWGGGGTEIIFEAITDEEYGTATYITNNPQGSYMDIYLDEELAFGESLSIYQNGTRIFNSSSGFDKDSLRVPTVEGSKLEFKIGKVPPEAAPEPVWGVSFVGEIEFDKKTKEDGRGREITLIGLTGDIKGTTYESRHGFGMDVRLKAGEEVHISLPNQIIPFVDYEAIEEGLNAEVDKSELGEYERIFYTDLNDDIGNTSGSVNMGGAELLYSSSQWEIVGVSEYMQSGNTFKDGVIGAKSLSSGDSVEIRLNKELPNGSHLLSIEYGGEFSGSVVIESVETGDVIGKLTQQSNTLQGLMARDLQVPAGTKSIRVVYK